MKIIRYKEDTGAIQKPASKDLTRDMMRKRKEMMDKKHVHSH